jgi:pimeloyl-ACP methyl ester carboxylesterase
MPSAHAYADRFVTVRGLRLHLIDRGDPASPAIVFLHGITGHARTWDREAEALAAQFRVIALDQRGHGDSARAPDGEYSNAALADDFAAVVDEVGLTRFRLVGLSLGGRVAIAYAGTHPDRVERLVVVDIGPDIAPAGMKRVMAMMGACPDEFATEDDALAWLRTASPLYDDALLRQRVTHGLTRLTGGGFAWKYDPVLRENARKGRGRPAPELWALWKAIECPTLLVQGQLSDLLTDDIAERMLESQPRARRVVVAGAGHTVPGDQPDAFMALLRQFLQD